MIFDDLIDIIDGIDLELEFFSKFLKLEIDK